MSQTFFFYFRMRNNISIISVIYFCDKKNAGIKRPAAREILLDHPLLSKQRQLLRIVRGWLDLSDFAAGVLRPPVRTVPGLAVHYHLFRIVRRHDSVAARTNVIRNRHNLMLLFPVLYMFWFGFQPLPAVVEYRIQALIGLDNEERFAGLVRQVDMPPGLPIVGGYLVCAAAPDMGLAGS